MGGMNEMDILRLSLTAGIIVSVVFIVKFLGYYIVRRKVKGVEVVRDDTRDDDSSDQ